MILRRFHPWIPTKQMQYINVAMTAYCTSIRQCPTAGCIVTSCARNCFIFCESVALPRQLIVESSTDNCLKGYLHNFIKLY